MTNTIQKISEREEKKEKAIIKMNLKFLVYTPVVALHLTQDLEEGAEND